MGLLRKIEGVRRCPSPQATERAFHSGPAARTKLYLSLTMAVSLVYFGGLARTAAGQSFNPVVFFSENCAMCHSIGGGAGAGPDLKDVHQRASREWLISFLLDPEGTINRGDPRAVALQQQFGGLLMPTVEMTTEQAEAVLLWLEWESARMALEQGQAVTTPAGGGSPPLVGGDAASARELTPEDAARGRAQFEGSQVLSNRGPACIVCHSLNGLEGLGGGKLGPDLSGVLDRLGGRRGLESWLRMPPTPTMRLLYRTHPLTSAEALDFVAYFEQASTSPPPGRSAGLLLFVGLSAAGAVLGLLLLGIIWKDRLRSVHRALVAASQR